MTPPIRMVSVPVETETRSAIAQMICGYKLRQGKRTDTDKAWYDALETADRIAALTAAPVREEGGAEDEGRLFAEVPLGAAALYRDLENGIRPILATREEAPAEAGESAEAIVRRWANWIIDESSDMDHDDHDAGKRKIRSERDFILSAIRAQPQAREEAQPVQFGYWVDHRAANSPMFIKHGSFVPASDHYKITPLYTSPPAPEAEKLRVAVEALTRTRRLVAEASESGFSDPDTVRALFVNNGAITQALAALQAEQGAK